MNTDTHTQHTPGPWHTEVRAVLDVPANEPARVVLLVPQIRDAIAKAEGRA